nr:integrase, catalytic region, zinc finger, CCHC-type, peptidase aspartic, catalytic [Tanacetum cinerariifolium]
MTIPQQPQVEFPQLDSGLAILTFLPSDDLIACMNKEMAFMSAVFSPCYPSTNNQLRSSSNLRNQATVQDGRVTVLQVQGRQGVICSTGASRSKPTCNTKNNRISQSSSSNKINKVEDQSRSVRSRKNKKNHVVKTECNAHVMQSMLNANSKSACAICNEYLFDANHDKYALEYVHDVNVMSKSKPVKRKNKKQIWKPTGKVYIEIGYKWKPTGRTFTIVRNKFPLTRFTSTKVVPLKEIIIKSVSTPTPGIKVLQIVMWYLDSERSKHMTGNRSQLTNFINKFLGTVKFGNDQIVKIMGYGDYQIRNITISRVYYVEGLRHNLFFIGKFCDSNLEVAFHKYTCFVYSLEGVDLLMGSQGTNLYTLFIGDMKKSFPICLLLKASKTKSWLWHRCLSHLNFGTINQLAQQGKLKAKVDVGIFIGYALVKKAYRIYNKCTKQIMETIHVDFDELTAMASEQSSPGPALHEMTFGTLSSGLTVFLNAILREEVYVNQPDEFVDLENPNYVYKLKKTFYGLKQAPRAWYDLLSSFLLSHKFSKGTVDPTLFIRREGKDILLAKPIENHLHTVKRIFRYLRGTINMGLWYSKDSYIALTDFADVDHAACQDTKRSTSGNLAFQINNKQLKKGRHEIMPYSRLKFVRVGEDFKEYGLPIPKTMLTEGIKQSESYQMFIKYSTGLISPKKSRGKGSQGKKIADAREVAIEVSEESNSKHARKRTGNRRVIKKKVTISADDNIIPDPNIAVELGKSMSLTEAADEEAARQKLKGVLTLTPEEKLVADTMQALKESKKTSRRQLRTGGSSEGTGVSPGVPNESIAILVASSEGTSTKTGVPDEEKTDDEETGDEHVHSEEHVQDDDEETDDEFIHGDEQVNDDEDEETTNAEVEESRNDDEEIIDAAKADAEKTEKVKDDTKKAKFPPSSSNLSVYLGFGDQFLKISSNTSLIGTIKDTTDADINSLLDVKIQQEIPYIQSPSALNVPVLMISKPLVLTPMPKTPLLVHATTLLPYPSVSTIPPVLHQTTTPILTPPITTKSLSVTMILDPLHQVDYKEMIEESVQANIINEVKNKLPKFLPNVVSNFATLVIQSAVKNVLDNIPLLKVLRKKDRNEEDPSTGPNKGKKTNRSRTKESKSSNKSSISKESSKGKYPVKTSKSSKFVTAEELVKEQVFEMASDDMEQTVNDAVNDVDQPHDNSTQANDKAPKKDCIELEYNMEEYFKALIDKLDWNNLEEDHCPFDLTKPLPLKGRPSRLTVVVECFFNNDLGFLKSLNPD